MIVDHIRNAQAYAKLGERVAAGLKYLTETNFAGMPNGKVEIRGKEIYAIVNQYETKPQDQGKWEAHRRYIDIQYVVGGCEKVGFGDVADMKIAQDYNAEKDCAFYSGKGDFVSLSPGLFAIFLPHDAHMPGVTHGAPSKVTKVVVKVAVG
jgi:YhcH/YjgK/YiaL family protein